MPSAETGELPALAEGATCLSRTSVGRLGDEAQERSMYPQELCGLGLALLEAGLSCFSCPQGVKC